MEEQLILLPELIAYLKVSKWTVYRWIREKDLPVYKIGGLNRFKKSEIDEWIMKFKRT